MDNKVTDNPELSRFELTIPGSDDPALAFYRLDPDQHITLIHTEVPEALSGQGIGSRLAQGVFDLIRASGRKVVPQCPFMRAWLDRHPAYADLAVPSQASRSEGQS